MLEIGYVFALGYSYECLTFNTCKILTFSIHLFSQSISVIYKAPVHPRTQMSGTNSLCLSVYFSDEFQVRVFCERDENASGEQGESLCRRQHTTCKGILGLRVARCNLGVS